jgi:RNA polymerase sigma factor (sigma-70 family)
VSDPDRASRSDGIGGGKWSGEVAGLYRTFGPWLIAFFVRRFGREIAEDLAQETFLRISQHPIDWHSPKSLLANVAIKVARDHLRRAGRQKRPRLVGGDHLPEGVTLPDQHEDLLHRQVVASLPRNLRDVYVLSRFVGLTYAEIAVHQGIGVKAVEKRMAKALKLATARYRA